MTSPDVLAVPQACLAMEATMDGNGIVAVFAFKTASRLKLIATDYETPYGYITLGRSFPMFKCCGIIVSRASPIPLTAPCRVELKTFATVR
jgi:hypothetical protein